MCGRVRVRSHATHGQACVYKTIWKNGNKEYNEKYLWCFFTKWNLKSAISYKCGRVVLFLTQVYFSITKLILLFSYCSHVPCMIISKEYYYIVLSMFPFVFKWSQWKASAVNQMSPSLFWSPKIFFCSFQFFENGHIHNVVSTLINVMKLDVENNSIVSTLSNVVNINIEIDNLDLTLFQRWFDILWRYDIISP